MVLADNIDGFFTHFTHVTTIQSLNTFYFQNDHITVCGPAKDSLHVFRPVNFTLIFTACQDFPLLASWLAAPDLHLSRRREWNQSEKYENIQQRFVPVCSRIAPTTITHRQRVQPELMSTLGANVISHRMEFARIESFVTVSGNSGKLARTWAVTTGCNVTAS